jgi:hypothetical protein
VKEKMSDDKNGSEALFVLPKWLDEILPVAGVVLGLAPVYIILMVWFGLSPKTQSVGYAPVQPVDFSHAIHAGQLGLDCRYCHNTVEYAATAAIPPTATCMACHAAVKTTSEKLELVRSSNETGMPIPWIRVHNLPDYVYFNHSAHLTAGVSCVDCHGRVDAMERVYQFGDLSMGWCLDCHRNAAPHLRPAELVTRLDWTTDEDRNAMGARLMEEHNIHPSTDCSTCHR